MSDGSANRRGITAMLVSMAFFTVNDVIVKLVSVSYPATQIITVRGIFASIAFLVLAGLTGALRDLGAMRSPLILGRTVLETASALLFVTVVARAPLANVMAVLQATPILITALSVVFFREKVGWRRWTAVAVGFLGMLIVARPSPTQMDNVAALALLCAFLIACRDLVTRRIGADLSTVTVALAATSGVAILGGLVSLAGFGGAWGPFTAYTLALLATSAIFLAAGNYFIVLAFRTGETSLVSPFRYSVILWATIAGYLVWGDIPDLATVIGAGLIVGAGIFTLYRERVTRIRAESVEP
jgi:drug/metabolite transporter (DMT)-like permease